MNQTTKQGKLYQLTRPPKKKYTTSNLALPFPLYLKLLKLLSIFPVTGLSLAFISQSFAI